MKYFLSFRPLYGAAVGALVSYYGFASVLRSEAVFLVLAACGALIALGFSLPLTLRTLNVKSRFLACARLLALAFALGFVLGLAALTASLRDAVVRTGLAPESLTAVSGRLLDDPRVSAAGRGMASLKLSGAEGRSGVRTSASGKLLVFFPEGSMPSLREFGRGSSLYIEGNIFTTDDGRTLFKAKSVHITKTPSPLNRLRTTLRLGLIGIFSERRWGGLALALLLGIRDNLDSELALQYQKAGCSYILALSGMHLAIVSSIIAFLLRKRLGIKAAAVLGSIVILAYIYLVGPQSSLVRASISYILMAFTIIFSRKAVPLNILALSFLIQILIDGPAGSTLSFMLSYLALAGIILLGGRIAGLLRGFLPDFLYGAVAASLGAFLATMSISAAFFGEIRVAGIAAGLVMVPLTTFFMIGAIIYLGVQLVIPPAGALILPLFDIVLSLLYDLLGIISRIAGGLPALTINNKPAFVVIFSLLPFALIYLFSRLLELRNKLERFY
ncbi:MAG: ComEC/Rec2 family competence protein [Spirochaetaceae bacterium]|jgi:competence protein ComEC|nr:ComEC/Rec2 family competence protein [Spirochaetaceae bacterium]